MSKIFFVDPYYQFKGKNGRLNVGGSVTIYNNNTSDLSDVYEADGVTVKQNPFIIDNNGRASFKLDEDFTYRMEVKDIDNKLLWTCRLESEGIVDIETFEEVVEELSGQLPKYELTEDGLVSAVGTISGGVSGLYGLGGMSTIYHDNTMSGSGTYSSPLGVSPLTNLAVDETLTAYTSSISGSEALILGVNGDYFDEKYSGKQDKLSDAQLSAISSVSSLAEDLLDEVEDRENADIALGTRIDNKQDKLTEQQIDDINYIPVAVQDISDLEENKQDKLTFGYNDNNEISAINSSAIAGGITGEYLPLSGGTVSGDIILSGNKTFSADALNGRSIVIGSLSSLGKDDGIMLYQTDINKNRIYLRTSLNNSNTQISNSLLEVYDTTGTDEEKRRAQVRASDVVIKNGSETVLASLTGINSTVNSNSANWNTVSSKQDTLTFTYIDI